MKMDWPVHVGGVSPWILLEFLRWSFRGFVFFSAPAPFHITPYPWFWGLNIVIIWILRKGFVLV